MLCRNIQRYIHFFSTLSNGSHDGKKQLLKAFLVQLKLLQQLFGRKTGRSILHMLLALRSLGDLIQLRQLPADLRKIFLSIVCFKIAAITGHDLILPC
ncbi:hypothetical protein D3C74_353740 [compost metagenome]